MMTITLQKSNQLKSIAILMMLCLHLFNRDYKGLFEPLIFIGKQTLSYYISLFSDACVPIFAFVSGYGLYFKYRENSAVYLKGNLLRLKKLYINYWIVLLLFAVLLGWLLQSDSHPGSWFEFIENFSGLNPTYNGAWWFFTTYVFFVLTSRFWFQLLDKTNPWLFGFALLIIYVIGFYFRIYKTDIFQQGFLHYFHNQAALYFCTLPQFMLGAFALKYEWHKVVSQCFTYTHTQVAKNSLIIALIVVIIVFHGLFPNFIIAPFTALAFIFLFLQLKLPVYLDNVLDFFTPHATNLWLIHMFFYMIYFPDFVYGFKYVPLIFIVLVVMSLLSSYVVNFIIRQIQKII